MYIPLDKQVIVFGLKDEDNWYGTKIIRPESTKTRTNQGVVRAVGPRVKDVQVGDYVVYSTIAGQVMDDSEEGNTQIIISEDAIFFVLIPQVIQVPGLFFKSKTGEFQGGHEQHEYIPATNELVHKLLREAYMKLPRFVEMKHKQMEREGA